MIDTQTPYSPGWWMQQLSTRLTNPRRQRRFDMLDRHYRGDPPLPVGAENQRSAYQAFQRKARSNFAALIVDAPRSMLQVRAIRTSLGNDDAGDALAWSYFRRNRLQVHLMDVWRWMLTLSESYMSVGMPDTEPLDGSEPVPVIAAEDPRQMITLDDPATRRPAAALKMFTDELTGKDYAYLWLPGELHVATRERSGLLVPGRRVPTFDQSFALDESLSATWEPAVVPVVKFRNRGGVGEFETVLDVLDRINHMLLMRMVLATFQAHRQRAIQVSPEDMPDKDPESGEVIDYDDILAADPGALWKLPADAKMWESSQADLTPMLTSVKDDVLHLAAITRTPLTMFTPDAATQTAEGAQLQREGLVFKVEDLQALSSDALAEVYSLAFTFAGHADRAQLDSISVDWRPAERYSLAERAAASVQAAQAQVPWRTRMQDIMQFTPEKVDMMEAEREEDALFLAAHPATSATPTPQLPPTAAAADRSARAEDVANEAVG